LDVAEVIGRSSLDEADDRSLLWLLPGISQPFGSGLRAELAAVDSLPQLCETGLALGAGRSQLDGMLLEAGFDGVGRLGQPDSRARLGFTGHLFAGFSP